MDLFIHHIDTREEDQKRLQNGYFNGTCKQGLASMGISEFLFSSF